MMYGNDLYARKQQEKNGNSSFVLETRYCWIDN